jgi:hypothetical protein
LQRISKTIVLLVVATFAAVATAGAAEEPTLEEYVGRVEPICKANTEASHHILAGARDRVKSGKLEVAGKQFARAASAFGSSIKQLEAVPRPPAYEAKLTKWFGHLKIVEDYLQKISKALKEGDKLRTTYEVVKLRSSANSTNNVIYDLGFTYCRITESRFK